MGSRSLNSVEWQANIPGSQIARREVCQQLVDISFETDEENRVAMIRQLARWGVLTGGQIAKLLGVTRQAAYVRRLSWQAEKPAHAVRGDFDISQANSLLRAVLAKEQRRELSVYEIAKLKEFGPRGIVFHLTGVDYVRDARK